MALPLITCVIPTCNRPLLVVRAINSVLSQSYQNVDVIVVDDSTNDDTKNCLQNFGSSIRYIRNTGRRGAPRSRNIGIMDARGEIITFLDDDDAWMRDKLSLQIELLKKYPLVSCNFYSRCGWRKRYFKNPPIISYRMMLYGNYLGSSSFVMTETKMAKECLFDEDLTVGQDWGMWLSIMKKNGISEGATCSKYLVDYNEGGHARISLKNYDQKIPMIQKIYSKYCDDHDEWTTKMFDMKNITWHGKSLPVKLRLSYMMARMENRSIFNWVRSVFMDVLGIVQY